MISVATLRGVSGSISNLLIQGTPYNNHAIASLFLQISLQANSEMVDCPWWVSFADLDNVNNGRFFPHVFDPIWCSKNSQSFTMFLKKSKTSPKCPNIFHHHIILLIYHIFHYHIIYHHLILWTFPHLPIYHSVQVARSVTWISSTWSGATLNGSIPMKIRTTTWTSRGSSTMTWDHKDEKHGDTYGLHMGEFYQKKWVVGKDRGHLGEIIHDVTCLSHEWNDVKLVSVNSHKGKEVNYPLDVRVSA